MLSEIFKTKNNSKNMLIVSNQNKKRVLEEKSLYEISNKKLLDIKIKSESELLDILTFKVKDEVFLFLEEKYNMPITIAKQKILFSKYLVSNEIEDLFNFKRIISEFIVEDKKIKNSFKKINMLFLEEPIYVVPILKNLGIKYEVIEPIITSKIPSVKKFNTINEEIISVFEEISKLLESKISIEDIAIANLNSEYQNLVFKYSKLYNIPVALKDESTLYDYKIIRDFLTMDFSLLIEYLSDAIKLESYLEENKINTLKQKSLIRQLILVINRFPLDKYSESTYKKVLESELKNTKVKQDILKNQVSVIEVSEVEYSKVNHIFIINAAYEAFPKIVKDNMYLSDKIKKIINYPTSDLINNKTGSKYKKIIKNSKISMISFASRGSYTNYEISDLIDCYALKTEEKVLELDKMTKVYSLNTYKDYLKKTKIDETEYKKLNTFNSEFNVSKEDRKKLINYLSRRNILISPSSLASYIKSPFIYYLNQILKVSDFKETISTKLGNFFHLLAETMYLIKYKNKISEKYSNDDLDNDTLEYIKSVRENDFNSEVHFDKIFQIFFKKELEDIKNVTSDYKFAVEVTYFAKKNKTRSVKALNFLIELEKRYESSEIRVEEQIIKNEFNARIDLLKINELNEFIIIDYKTSGKTEFDKEKLFSLFETLENDFDAEIDIKNIDLLQLVFYAYLIYIIDTNKKLTAIGYFSYLDDDLKINNVHTKEIDANFFKNRSPRNVTFEELEDVYYKIENLIYDVRNRILKAYFNVKVRKSIGNKNDDLEKNYNSYQAILFKSDIEEDNSEE